jgi:hypothetical protein
VQGTPCPGRIVDGRADGRTLQSAPGSCGSNRSRIYTLADLFERAAEHQQHQWRVWVDAHFEQLTEQQGRRAWVQNLQRCARVDRQRVDVHVQMYLVSSLDVHRVQTGRISSIWKLPMSNRF